MASMGIMVGKTEKVDMAFTRANGVARLLVSVLDIEYVPDKVNWTYRGEVFPLEIEFEDTDLFAEAINGNDVDMHEGDDSAGARGHRLMSRRGRGLTVLALMLSCPGLGPGSSRHLHHRCL